MSSRRKSLKPSRTREESRKQDRTEKEANQKTATVVQDVFNGMLELQAIWIEANIKQTELTLKLISQLAGFKSDVLDMLLDFIREGSEGFLKLQKKWIEILTKQIFVVESASSDSVSMKSYSKNLLEGISQMQNAWMNFIHKQLHEFSEVVGKNQSEQSTISFSVDIADSLIKGFEEAQRRWIEVAKTMVFVEEKK
ncbi:MAG: hypothetical protein N2Z23_02175 [Pyrinomonadaceae bacterium]|nr:hypothetical protein [Pyrinomonadaceae bacterium]MCX7639237.1 hypothetical protein [Pyrinomonadaceae bacterium]MDW8303541.1 hypothetical protein [Acidobacteriota bacterium]